MKSVQIVGALVTLLFLLPLSIYGGWLLYNHVHATELMWFIWWVVTPLSALLQIIFKIAEIATKPN